jgi:hypothetical protein
VNHPDIADFEQTCGACPEQYEGTLNDGSTFYFRYRHGWASLGIGADLDAAVCDPREVGESVGDHYQGMFDTEDQRDAVFARLLDQRRTATP